MWPYLTYNKFAVEKFRPLDPKESAGCWEARTVSGSRSENRLGNISHQIGTRIQQGLIELPSVVEVPRGAIVKRGSGLIITRTFEVVTPFEAPLVRATNAYFVVTDPDEPSVSVLVPNYLLDSSPSR